MILLDTHVLLWLDAGLPNLGAQTRARADEALQSGNLLVSAISFWEVAMLREKGRIRLGIDPVRWRSELITKGLKERRVSGAIGITAATLNHFHGDLADRMIVATALEADATLMTADKSILDWQGPLQRTNATR